MTATSWRLPPPAAPASPPDQALVVFHAATRAQVPQPLRKRLDETIAALGRRRPLVWLSLEGPIRPDARLPSSGPFHVLALRCIAGKTRTEEHLAIVEGHAAWLQPLDR